jgi:hypothetical protein
MARWRAMGPPPNGEGEIRKMGKLTPFLILILIIINTI